MRPRAERHGLRQGGGSQRAVQKLLVTETAAQLALQAADGDEILRRPRVLVRGAGQRRQQPGTKVGQPQYFRNREIGGALEPDDA
jgi:hypothetical protein